jgi:hypothetical protein
MIRFRTAPKLVVLMVMLLSLGCSHKGKGDEPGFRISRGEHSHQGTILGIYWTITNTSDAPLTVTRVRYNGDWDAPRGFAYANGSVRPAQGGLPVRLTIGEACHFFQSGFDDEPNYTKAVIYIDIETNRGTFRYQDGESRPEALRHLRVPVLPSS